MKIRDDLDAERDWRLSCFGAHASAAIVKSAGRVLGANAGLIAADHGFLSLVAAHRLLSAKALPDEAASGM